VARSRAPVVLFLLALGCSSGPKKADPERARVLFHEGLDLQEKDRHEEATETFTEALGYNPTYADAYAARAYSWLQMRKMEKPPVPVRMLIDRAFSDYTAAVSANPTFADAYFSRAMILCSRARYQDAVADLLVCSRYKPKDPEPHLLMGEIYEHKFENQMVLAMKHYEEYVKLGGTNAQVREKVALWKQLTAQTEAPPKKEPTADDEKKAEELHQRFKQLPPTSDEAFRAIEELVTRYNHTKYYKKHQVALNALYAGLKENREKK
jgi:tetratricopeptide (TPR) repeat protein